MTITSSDITRAKILGIAWGCVPLSYAVAGANTLFQGLLLVLAASLLTTEKHVRPLRDSFLFLLLISLLMAVSILVEIGGKPEPMPYVTIIAMLAQFFLLSAVVRPDSFALFSNYFFRATSFSAAVHIAMAFTGMVDPGSGRFGFIGNSHPNLGGEIYAIGSVLGAFALQRKTTFIILIIPVLFSSYLMQTRSGMVAVALALAIKVVMSENGRFISKRSLKYTGLVAGCLILAASLPSVQLFLYEQVFRLNDPYRGVEAGMLSGRDEQWALAFDHFVRAPFFGHGLSFFQSSEVAGAHNAVLYSLAMFGSVGLAFWVWFIYIHAKLFMNHRRAFYFLAPMWVLVLLNDRFLNLNPYPFLYYFSLIQLANKGMVGGNAIRASTNAKESIGNNSSFVSEHQ